MAKYVGSGDNEHGFGYVSKKQLKASNSQATYYGFTKGKFRIIMLDSNAEGGGSEGNIDNPQYKWLAKELDKYSSTEIVDGKVKRDNGKDKLIIISSHHTLATMNNPTPDEKAGACDKQVAGTDCDPRKSTPLHFGLKGKQNLKKLLLRYPNVVAYVNGHTHHNAVNAYKQPKSSKFKGGFWQINTASHVDWPQQSRTIQLFDNQDGTLSIFGTILDTAASVEAPAPGTDATTMSNGQLASLSRLISANDPQWKVVTDGGGPGKIEDFADRQVLRSALRQIVRAVHVQQRDDVVIGKAPAPFSGGFFPKAGCSRFGGVVTERVHAPIIRLVP